MSQIADDYIALLGLTYAGYGRDVNPYVDVILTNSVELTELLQSAPIDKGDYAAVWDYGGQLEACNQDEITTLDPILSEYLALQDAAQQISSLDLLAAFGDAQIAWRSELWPTLPNCAEAFEIGLHIFPQRRRPNSLRRAGYRHRPTRARSSAVKRCCMSAWARSSPSFHSSGVRNIAANLSPTAGVVQPARPRTSSTF